MLTIAIDGTSASGKSKIASLLAEHFNIGYFNTGEVYRTITHILLKNQISSNDISNILKTLENNQISVEFEGVKQHMLVNGERLNIDLKSKEINENVASFAKIPEVREIVVKIQRKHSEENDIVMEGRDIGTNVLPNAKFKFFLGASNKERTKRRVLQLKEKNNIFEEDEISKALFERDMQDITRECKPLVIAEDGYYIDSSEKNIEQTLEYILKIIEKYGE